MWKEKQIHSDKKMKLKHKKKSVKFSIWKCSKQNLNFHSLITKICLSLVCFQFPFNNYFFKHPLENRKYDYNIVFQVVVFYSFVMIAIIWRKKKLRNFEKKLHFNNYWPLILKDHDLLLPRLRCSPTWTIYWRLRDVSRCSGVLG